MLANIEKIGTGYIARFERSLSHSLDEAWAALTENALLEKWMSNLEIVSLQKGGIIKFNMNDGTGTSMEMTIIDFQEKSVLEFEWGEDHVRFEIHTQKDGCFLVLKEYISQLTDHTPKDLAGWHVCLDVMSTLLNGHLIEFSTDEWQKWFEQYTSLVNQLNSYANDNQRY